MVATYVTNKKEHVSKEIWKLLRMFPTNGFRILTIRTEGTLTMFPKK